MPLLGPHIQAIEDAHEYLGLSYQKLAEALRADESTLHHWRSGGEPSPVFAARIEALDELLGEMRETFRNAEAARRWLGRAVPAVENRTPAELIAQGRLDILKGVLYALNSGAST